MPSNDNTVSTKKIKRTSFSPWNSGMMASRAKSGNSQLLGRSSELARIAVDIVENAAVKSSAMGLLAGNSKIMAAQKEWERSQSASLPGDGENTAVGAQVRGGQGECASPLQGCIQYPCKPFLFALCPCLIRLPRPAHLEVSVNNANGVTSSSASPTFHAEKRRAGTGSPRREETEHGYFQCPAQRGRPPSYGGRGCQAGVRVDEQADHAESQG